MDAHKYVGHIKVFDQQWDTYDIRRSMQSEFRGTPFIVEYPMLEEDGSKFVCYIWDFVPVFLDVCYNPQSHQLDQWGRDCVEAWRKKHAKDHEG